MTMAHRILMAYAGDTGSSGGAASLDDMVFGYFEEDGLSSPGSCCDGFNDDEDEAPENVAESKAFWEDKHQLLKACLSRTSSLESRVKQVIKDAMNGPQFARGICVCGTAKPDVGMCRDCAMRDICNQLQNAGFNSAICKSKWRSSPTVPAGEHTYVEVIEKSAGESKKGELTRVVIELGFRAEFEMARANEEYNKLISRLPEVFIGKDDRLRTLIKILCSAGKKCMKENKMHMAPWRKHKYMQAKWFGPCKRTVSSPLVLPEIVFHRPVKSKSSLLTFDMLEKKLPQLQHFNRAVVAAV